MTAYDVIQEICTELKIDIKLVAGFTREHIPFMLQKEKKINQFCGSTDLSNIEPFGFKKSLLKVPGICHGPVIEIGRVRNRKTFNLCDPNSILELKSWLKSNRCWIK